MNRRLVESLNKLRAQIRRIRQYEWGIKGRVLTLVLVPMISVAAALSFYFISTQISGLERALHDRSRSLINQLAAAASHHSLDKERATLQDLARTALTETDVTRITIKDRLGETVLSVASPPDTRTSSAGLFRYKAPIVKTYAGGDADTLGWVFGEFTLKGIDAQKRTVMAEGLFITLIGLVISTYLALRAGKNVTDPIIRLTETVKKIARGKLHTRVQGSAKGEIGILEQGVNSMGTVLQQTHQSLQSQIESATVQLRTALADMEIQNEELDKARKQALDASQIKTEFLTNMSHEIRTPLNAILGFTKLLLKSELDSQQREQVRTIEQSTHALLRVINDTLDFSQIEAGTFTIEQVPFDLREIIEDSVALLTPNAYDKGLDIILMIYSDVPKRIIGDPARIRQIITNLAANAIKFTPSGCITIRVMLEDEDEDTDIIKVSVQDTGVGISRQEQDRLFDPYVKAKRSGVYSNVRLGLVVCKRLVESMGGEMGIDSTPGSGSTFWFSFQAGRVRTETECPTGINPLQNYRCLLYDGNELSRLAIIHQISDWDIEIRETDDFDAIPELLRKFSRQDNKRTLAIIALNKQELESDAFKRLVRAIRNPRAVPIIVMATSVDKQLYDKLLKQGASLVVPKTIRVQHLYGKLCNILISSLLIEQHRTREAGNLVPDDLDLNGLNILVVDDNRVNRKLNRALLAQHRARIYEASDGEQAVRIFADKSIDFVLMDLQMPVMSGIEATAQIRDMEADGKRTPIIALSANIIDTDQEKLLASGFNDILIKPVEEETLLALIDKWVDLKAGAEERRATATAAAAPSPAAKAPAEPGMKKRKTAGGRPSDRFNTSDKPEDAARATAGDTKKTYFDRDQALKLTGGNLELAEELYQMLLDDLPEMKLKLNQALNPLNYEKLQHVAHKIHGAASYCAVPLVKDSASRVETAAKNKVDRDIYRLVRKLNKDIDTLLA